MAQQSFPPPVARRSDRRRRNRASIARTVVRLTPSAIAHDGSDPMSEASANVAQAAKAAIGGPLEQGVRLHPRPPAPLFSCRCKF